MEKSRTCTRCKQLYPIECFHLRSAKKDQIKKDTRCKFCVNTALTKRNKFLTAFHKNAKLILSEEVYKQIKEI
jgi:hypothetical protein